MACTECKSTHHLDDTTAKTLVALVHEPNHPGLEQPGMSAEQVHKLAGQNKHPLQTC